MWKDLNLDHYRSGFSHDVREGFIFTVKILFSHLYIGFALIHPFIHLQSLYVLILSLFHSFFHSNSPNHSFAQSFVRSLLFRSFTYFSIAIHPLIYSVFVHLFTCSFLHSLARFCSTVFISNRTSLVHFRGISLRLVCSRHGSHFCET